MKKAILVTPATCIGSGSDLYKRINGVTKKITEICDSIDPNAAILTHSHTNYQGQKYKLAIRDCWGWKHRQINDSDYEIIAIVDYSDTRTITINRP